MRTVTLSDAKKNLRALIQDVRENSEPAVIVDEDSADQAVLISIDDYRSLEETAYLLSSPANRTHLEESLRQASENKTVPFQPEEL